MWRNRVEWDAKTRLCLRVRGSAECQLLGKSAWAPAYMDVFRICPFTNARGTAGDHVTAILYLLQGKPHHSCSRHAWQLEAPEPPSQVGPSVRSFGSRKSVVNATGSALALCFVLGHARWLSLSNQEIGKAPPRSAIRTAEHATGDLNACTHAAA